MSESMNLSDSPKHAMVAFSRSVTKTSLKVSVATYSRGEMRRQELCPACDISLLGFRTLSNTIFGTADHMYGSTCLLSLFSSVRSPKFVINRRLEIKLL